MSRPRPRRLAAVAGVGVLLLAAGLLRLAAGGRGSFRVAATLAFLPGLSAWDRFNAWLDPHSEFTRAPVRRNLRPLSEQAAAMEADLAARFLIEDGRLLLLDTAPSSLGDVCLWQGVHAGAAALRLALDPSARSRRAAEAAVDGLGLLSTRGLPIARAVYPVTVPTEPGGRKYFRAGGWQWKEDASVDSAAGWVFGAVLALELVPSRREAALAGLRRFADTLMAGDYLLRNSDGTPTRYSSLGGRVVNSPTGMLVTLAALAALDRHTGETRYRRERRSFLDQGQHRWAAYASGPLLWRNMTTNYNIAYLALAAALAAEDDPAAWRAYALGMVRLDRITARMGNSFWTYLSRWSLERRPELARGLAGEPEFARWSAARAESLRRARKSMLEWDYPACKVKRETVNSVRADLEWARWPLLGRRTPAQPLPLWQRPPADFVWQRSPYALDDWSGYAENPPQAFAPLDFLVAYYLGRLTGGLAAGD